MTTYEDLNLDLEIFMRALSMKYKDYSWSFEYQKYHRGDIIDAISFERDGKQKCRIFLDGKIVWNDNTFLTINQIDDFVNFSAKLENMDFSEHEDEIKGKKDEAIKSPNHYQDENGKDLFYHFKNGLMSAEKYIGFLIGNIFKYIVRHGKKDKKATIQDLKKARYYLDELIAFEEGRESND